MLPMSGSYDTVRRNIFGPRNLAGITMATLHYTASPANLTIAQIAASQLQRDAAPGEKFPGLAYTYIVGGDGTPYQAWDLDVRVWHSAARGKNSESVGICYVGDRAPTDAQIQGLRACIAHAEATLGRKLKVGGHKDDYATECPGPLWPQWRDAVLA